MDNGARALSIAAPTSGFRGVFDPEGFFGGTIDQWASLALILLVSLSVWDRVVPRHNPRPNPRRHKLVQMFVSAEGKLVTAARKGKDWKRQYYFTPQQLKVAREWYR